MTTTKVDIGVWDQERAARIKLEDVSGWPDRDRIFFYTSTGRTEFLSIPKGLDLAGKLLCVDAYEMGRAVGEEDGRLKLQEELRDLLDAAARR